MPHPEEGSGFEFHESVNPGSSLHSGSHRQNPKISSGTYRGGLGCEAKAALRLWHEFSRTQSDFHLTGQRQFRSDSELIQVIENEERSLDAFSRHLHLDGTLALRKLVDQRAKKTVGSEHEVILDSDNAKVIKVTLNGRYGRRWDTPSQYINRLALMNEIMPALHIQFEDFLTLTTGEHSIMTSMVMFQGPHPSAREIDDYLVRRGFESFSDRSGTVDYLHRADGLIFRDCHSANWVQSGKVLIPIDIIPDWQQDTPWEYLRELE